MVWGTIARGRKWPLLCLPPARIPGAVYAEQVLKGGLGGLCKGAQEADPAACNGCRGQCAGHNAKTADAVCSQLKIDRLYHLPSSSDLNPIERLGGNGQKDCSQPFSLSHNP